VAVGEALRIVVIGLPELGRLLAGARPGGAEVTTVAAGPDVERDLAVAARGATRETVLFVVAAGCEPAVDRLPARLARGGFRAVVVTGLGGQPAGGPVSDHGNLVELAAPFTADDVLAALCRLPGDVPLFLPVDGGDQVFGAGEVAAAVPAPTLDEWLASPEAADAGDDDDPLGPVVVTAAVGAVTTTAPGGNGHGDLDGDLHGDLHGDGDVPPWAHLPPPAPPPPPVDRPAPWADAGWPVPPVIPADALPTLAPAPVRRRGTVISVCSYKGGSGKCLTGDTLIVDPVTGVPHRLDEVVAAPDLGTVLTLDGAAVRCAPIAAKVDSGVQPTVRVDLASGRSVTVTPHHPFLVADGWRPAVEIAVGEAVAVPARTPSPLCPRRLGERDLRDLAACLAAAGGGVEMPEAAYRLPGDQLALLFRLAWPCLRTAGIAVGSRAAAGAVQHLLTRLALPSRVARGRSGGWHVAVTGGPAPADDDRAWDEVVAVTPAGRARVWDLTVEPTHCFVAGDVVVHNTTTALLAAGTLARALQPAGRRVALVDANTAQTSIGTVLQRPARGTILDLIRRDVDESLLATALTPVAEAGGLDVLLGAPDLRTTDRRLITTTLYRRVVASLRRTHDYVIVDTPVAEATGHELFDEFVLRDSDVVVVVLDPHRETIHNNVEWLDIIGDPVSAGGRNVAPEKVGVVLNRADEGQPWNGRTVGDHFRRYHYLGVIPESAAVARAADEGRLLDRFDDRVERAVRAVLAGLLDEPLLAPDAAPAPTTTLARLVSWRPRRLGTPNGRTGR
jgi:MinD-like ATPase involved in chromosome partitioning or flagellar assembly